MFLNLIVKIEFSLLHCQTIFGTILTNESDLFSSCHNVHDTYVHTLGHCQAFVITFLIHSRKDANTLI